MRASQSILRNLSLLAGFGLWTSLAFAGPLTVFTESGGYATLDVAYIDGSAGSSKVVDGGIGDTNQKAGEITHKIDDEDKVRAAALRAKVKVENPSHPASGPKYLPSVAKMGYKGKLPGETNLQFFEPLDVDQFVPPQDDLILLFDYDIPVFLQNGVHFSVGQVLTAVNGSIAGVAGLVFRDATSLFAGPADFFDVAFDLQSPLFDTLPLYSGQLTVASRLQFRLAEPGTLALVIGVLLLLIWRGMNPRTPVNRRTALAVKARAALSGSHRSSSVVGVRLTRKFGDALAAARPHDGVIDNLIPRWVTAKALLKDRRGGYPLGPGADPGAGRPGAATGQ